MKKIIPFLLLLFCSSIFAQGVLEHNEVKVASTRDYPFEEHVVSTKLSVSMKYNIDLYKDYVLKLTIPHEFCFPGADGFSTNISAGTEQVRMTKVSDVQSGNNHEIIFNVELLTITTGWNSINIPIFNIRNNFLNEDCSALLTREIFFDLKAKLITPANSPFENATQAKTVVTIPKGTSGDRQPSIGLSHNQGSVDKPFYYDITVSNVYFVNKIRFAMYYDKADFDFITVRRYYDQSYISDNYGYHHGEQISANVVGDSLIFEIDNAGGGNYYRFMVYLRPHNNATLDANHQVAVKIRENDPLKQLQEQTSCGLIKRFASKTDEGYGQITYTPGTYKQSLNHFFGRLDYSTCKDYCSKSAGNYIVIETNGTYLTSSSARGIRVNMRKNTRVTHIDFFNQYTTPIQSSFIVKYKVCGQSVESSTLYSTINSNNRILNLNQSLEYIIVEGMPVAAQAANDFVVYYEDDDLPASCGYNDKFEIGYTDQTLASVSSSVNIATGCTLSKTIADSYLADAVFNSGEEGYVRIGLYAANGNLPGTYNFNNITYSLNSKMSFTNEALKFYIGTNSNPAVSEFKPYANWTNSTLVGQGFVVSKVPFPLNKKNLVINNVRLNNTCGTAVYFYILAKVKAQAKLPRQDAGYQSTVTENDPNLEHSLQTWNNAGSFVLKGGAFLACGGQNNSNSSVRLGENIMVNYVIENAGPEKMNQFTLIIDKLSIGALDLVPDATGVLYKVDDNNARTLINNSITISGNQVSINSELLGYNKLELGLFYKIPNGSQYTNQIAVTNFSVEGKGADGTPSNVVKSNDLQLTISKSYSSCTPVSCSECITSFSPLPDQKYLLSAWVKEPLTDVTNTFLNTGIKITFNNGEVDEFPLFRPSGPIIDGWQRVEQSFTVPSDAKNIQIELVNESEGNNAFFDDIRVHPFKSNMKSFVYDPSTQKLVAELDENNYATFYEYDDEGILIRVKKETERGVMTIKESRNNQSKIFKNK
ncbi:hypothetical protein [Sporocytophaga myxococcoides]|uniref:hypothetical protein n=1 Tax=Sporocytophaga myxococcoides TaxID=153721 RepID=UPI0004233753|nr:hypothetical protein [Sporocytophaga myxococcoides]